MTTTAQIRSSDDRLRRADQVEVYLASCIMQLPIASKFLKKVGARRRLWTSLPVENKRSARTLYGLLRDRQSRDHLTKWLDHGGRSQLKPPNNPDGWKAIWLANEGQNRACLGISFPTLRARKLELVDDQGIGSLSELCDQLRSRAANFHYSDDPGWSPKVVGPLLVEAECIVVTKDGRSIFGYDLATRYSKFKPAASETVLR
jgi:hypothetical protein